MPFNDNENITQLNVELWIIPILILIILLYVFKSKKYKKVIVTISILYALFMSYSLYAIFSVIFYEFGAINYFFDFSYGFAFLAFTIFLIISLIFPTKVFAITAFILLIFVSFNQIYLRIETSRINDEYNNIVRDKSSSGVLSVQIDTTDDYYSNAPGFDSTYWYNFSIVKTMTFTPYFAINKKSFYYFGFPNYYWTKYSSYDRQRKSKRLIQNFIQPKLIERVKLITKSKIDEFYIIYKINRDGNLLKVIGTYPDSIKFVNKEEYLNSIKFVPAYLNNKPIDLTYFRKYFQ